MTTLPPPVGINWQAVITAYVNLLVEPGIGMATTPTGELNVAVQPSIGTEELSRRLELVTEPMIGARGGSKEGAAIRLEAMPSIGVGTNPTAVLNLSAPPSIGATGAPTESGRVGLTITPSIGLSGVMRIPVLYDATGQLASASVGSPISSGSWTHTATVGAYVIADIYMDRATTVTSCTYAGTPMDLLENISLTTGYSGDAVQYRFGLADVPGGANTIAFALSTQARGAAGSLSYLNVSNVVSTVGTNGSTGPTQSVTCSYDQMIVEATTGYRGAGITVSLTPSGGTNRYNQSGTDAALAVSDANSSTTFSAGGTVSTWGAIATVLSSY